MTLVDLTTRSRWFTCIRLLWYSPDGITVPPFPVTLTTMALYHSCLRWFEASTCMTASRGPPSSSIKHGLKFPSSPSWHTLYGILFLRKTGTDEFPNVCFRKESSSSPHLTRPARKMNKQQKAPASRGFFFHDRSINCLVFIAKSRIIPLD